MIQFGGAFGNRWSGNGGRKDYAADENIELVGSVSVPINGIPINSILTWITNSAGHSLHNNELSKALIINATRKAFETNKTETPVETPNESQKSNVTKTIK